MLREFSQEGDGLKSSLGQELSDIETVMRRLKAPEEEIRQAIITHLESRKAEAPQIPDVKTNQA